MPYFNATAWQCASRDRRAELDPFVGLSAAGKRAQPTPAGAARPEDPSGRSQSELGYGCVDWYLYPFRQGRPESALHGGARLRRH